MNQKNNVPNPSNAIDKWLAKNRSLVLRQTPVWAQSLAVIVLALGGITVSSAFLFKIDEVVSVSGKLESILGTVDVKTPAGGKISKVLFKDGEQ